GSLPDRHYMYSICRKAAAREGPPPHLPYNASASMTGLSLALSENSLNLQSGLTRSDDIISLNHNRRINPRPVQVSSVAGAFVFEVQLITTVNNRAVNLRDSSVIQDRKISFIHTSVFPTSNPYSLV